MDKDLFSPFPSKKKRGPNEEKYDKNITQIRTEIALKIQKNFIHNQTLIKNSPQFLAFIEENLVEYQESYKEYVKHVNSDDTKKTTWTFWNSMFYAGTIYTTIGK
ncbi:unnamed protein product [Euphydryas editha]|uniref:Uncharacterized protein n=1 Tax=Euphydryas editha TaxID=104508 RepID=A0AAU9UH02_EUPED|nr:unnamed protein product [Euphydryas editha]